MMLVEHFSGRRAMLVRGWAWLGLLSCLAGLVLLPGRAWAEEMQPHRLDFEADRSLPACNQRGDFIAALTSWVRLGVLDPEAPRVLEVRVRRLPEGGKAAKVTIKSAAGDVLGEKGQEYGPTAECFREQSQGIGLGL